MLTNQILVSTNLINLTSYKREQEQINTSQVNLTKKAFLPLNRPKRNFSRKKSQTKQLYL